MKLKRVINLFGGPCTGKSTIAAGLFTKMKTEGYNVELVPEYAKELTYDERFNILDQDQLYILAKQHRKIIRLKDQVDYIITDSPLLLSLIYSEINCNSLIYDQKIFKDLTLSIFNHYDNFNILLRRNEAYEYQQEGRYQDLDGAIFVDSKIKSALNQYGKYEEMESNYYTINKIFNNFKWWKDE